MSDVTLTWSEVRLGALSGVDQHLRELARNTRERWQAPIETAWQRHIDGRIGELVVAKGLGLYWAGGDFDRRHLGDVADLEVRTTPYPDGALIIHPDDHDTRPYLLVVGHPPTLRIVGWLTGRDAKRDRWWRTDVRHPAYFVPQTHLHPLDALDGVRA